MIPTLFENNVIDKLFNIVIKVSGDVVKLEVPYQCNGLEHGALANQRYREDIVKWKDQVELPNTVKVMKFHMKPPVPSKRPTQKEHNSTASQPRLVNWPIIGNQIFQDNAPYLFP